MVISTATEMQEAKSLVMQLSLDPVPLTHRVNVDIPEAEAEVRVTRHWASALKKCLGSLVIQVLDGLLFVILAPFMLWQWIFSHERLLIILKVLAQVTVELIVWTIFGGVAVTLTLALILDDIYAQKKDTEKLKDLLNSTHEPGLVNMNRSAVIGPITFGHRRHGQRLSFY